MPTTAKLETRITIKDAEPLLTGDLIALTDEQVAQCYDAYAGYISYLNADDYGDDWKRVPQYRPGLNKAAAELDRRGLDYPAGPYLL